MNKKFLITLIIFLTGIIIYLTGIGVSSYYSTHAVNSVLKAFNQELNLKYLQGLFPYKYEVSYKDKKKGFFKSRGSIVLSCKEQGVEIILPTKIYNNFLTLRAKVNIQNLVDNLLVYKNVLNHGAKSSGEFNLRLFPKNLTSNFEVKGSYDKKFIQKYRTHLSDYSNKELFLRLNLSAHNNKNIMLSLDVDNIATAWFSASRFYLINRIATNGTYPLREVLFGADNIFSSNKDFIDVDDVKLTTGKHNHEGLFKLFYDLDMNVRQGKILSLGEIGPLKVVNSNTRNNHSETLAPLNLNSLISKDGLTLKLNKLSMHADYKRIEKNIKYDFLSQGYINLPNAKSLLETVERAKGEFKIEMTNVSKDALDLVKGFEKQGEVYKTTFTLDPKGLQINNK